MTRTHPLARSALVLLLFLFAAVCAGCRADTTGLSTLTVEELAKLRDSGADLVLCDANNLIEADWSEMQSLLRGALVVSDSELADRQ